MGEAQGQAEARRCLGCGGAAPPIFLDLGRTPLANSYVRAEDAERADETFPLAVAYCEGCHLVQLAETVSPEKMFSEYAYFSSYSESFLAHARRMADSYIERFGLTSESRVLEIASNDGYLLQYFKRRGIGVLGVEPAGNIARVARERGIPTMECFFEAGAVGAILSEFGDADLIAGNNVLAHVPAINGFLSAVAAALKPRGVAAFEFPYIGELLANAEFDTIYHEHVFYYSLSAIEGLARRAGLEVFDVERTAVHGGSVRVFMRHQGRAPIVSAAAELLEEEKANGLLSFERYRSFGREVAKLKERLCGMLGGLKADGRRIAAYGAPAKGNTLLNYCGIGRETLEFTVDRSPHKQGKLLPGSHLSILAPEELLGRKPDYALILPWNIAGEIVGQQRDYVRAGGRFIVPVPIPRVLEAGGA